MKGYIRIYPRLHITLLDMGVNYRKNGGVGLSINAPNCKILYSKSDSISLNDCRFKQLSTSEIQIISDILALIRNNYHFEYGVTLLISGEMISHYGFGSGTAIRLACIEALFHVNNQQVTPEELIHLSRRGGTSGIGIHTYFNGGGVFDLGIKNNGTSFSPSNRTQKPTRPLLVDKFYIPNWPVGIAIPKLILPLTTEQEASFFHKTCPLSSEDIYKTVYEAIFGTYASLKESDFETFCNSVISIQSCFWKKSERLQYDDYLFKIEKILYESGAKAVGMSSLGPSLFFMAQNIDQVISTAQAHLKDSIVFFSGNMSNVGREIIYD